MNVLKAYELSFFPADRVSEADVWRTELENLVRRMETQMEGCSIPFSVDVL